MAWRLHPTTSFWPFEVASPPSRATSKSTPWSILLRATTDRRRTPMALEQYSTLLSALAHVPDPRKARGKRYPWTLLLTIIVAGLASNYQTASAIAHWASLHASELHAALPNLVRLPSASTLLRTLRQI